MRNQAAFLGLALFGLVVLASLPGKDSGEVHRAEAQTGSSESAPTLSVNIMSVNPILVQAVAASPIVDEESMLSSISQPANGSADAAAETLAPSTTIAPATTPPPTATLAPTVTPLPTTTPMPTQPPAPTATRAPTKAPDPAKAPIRLAPDHLLAPSIGLDTAVVSVGWRQVPQANGTLQLEWEVASQVAGWHKNSARPGDTGNIVIAGHSNIDGEVFKNLHKVQVGDEITLTAGGQAYTYKVETTFIVADKNATWGQKLINASWIGRFPDARLTLLTCWPPDNNTHRLFVIAKPVVGS